MVEIREDWDEQLHDGSGSESNSHRSSSARGQYLAAGAAATASAQYGEQGTAPTAGRGALPANSVESGSEEEGEELDDEDDGVALGELQKQGEAWKRRRLQPGNGLWALAPAGSGDAEVAGSDVMFGSEKEDEELGRDLEAGEAAQEAHALGSGSAAEGAGDAGHAEDDEGDFEALMARMEVGNGRSLAMLGLSGSRALC